MRGFGPGRITRNFAEIAKERVNRRIYGANHGDYSLMASLCLAQFHAQGLRAEALPRSIRPECLLVRWMQ